jgi:hypothetical protein
LAIEALEDRVLLSYGFTLLADDGPHSFFSAGSLGTPTMNDQGTVTFHAALRSGGEGVFTRDTAGALGIIAITSDRVHDFPIGGSINNAETVSFGADLRDGTQAIFTGRGQELSPIADTGPDSPFSGFFGPAATMNNDELVAFRASLTSGGTGIFAGRAHEPSSILYVSGGRYTAFLYSNLQRNGNLVAFRATLRTGKDGVFLGDGSTTITIATTGDIYSAFTGAVPPNDTGVVAFMANLTVGGQAIGTGDGDSVTTIADTSGPFSSFFGNAGINNDGQVAFAANLVAGGSGIFSVRAGVTDEIIATGDSLFGSTVTSFAAIPFAPRGLNNAGRLGFAANLADGRAVLVRADPEGAAPGSNLQVASLVSAIKVSGTSGGSVLVGSTEPVQSDGRNTSSACNVGFKEEGRAKDETMRQPAAPVLASSGGLGGDVQEHVFATFEGDWLPDALWTNLALAG